MKAVSTLKTLLWLIPLVSANVNVDSRHLDTDIFGEEKNILEDNSTGAPSVMPSSMPSDIPSMSPTVSSSPTVLSEAPSVGAVNEDSSQAPSTSLAPSASPSQEGVETTAPPSITEVDDPPTASPTAIEDVSNNSKSSNKYSKTTNGLLATLGVVVGAMAVFKLLEWRKRRQLMRERHMVQSDPNHHLRELDNEIL